MDRFHEEYGPNTKKIQAPRAKSGGVTRAGDVNGYHKPQGPIGINRVAVGLGGDNYGNCGTQARQAESHSESAEAKRYRGSRFMSEDDAYEGAEYGVRAGTSGRPGLGGSRHGSGTNRR